MNADILITDDRLGFTLSLADFLRVQGSRVCVTSDSNPKKEKNSERVIGPVISWNRSSLFSLQSLPIQCKNLQLNIDTAIIVFDAAAYLELYPDNDILTADRTITELITANMQLIHILIGYFNERKSGKLLFVHRDIPMATGQAAVAAASGAFTRMAEETVMLLSQEENSLLQTMLVKLEGEENTLYIEWLAAQISLPVLTRIPGRWIKASQRGFFGK